MNNDASVWLKSYKRQGSPINAAPVVVKAAIEKKPFAYTRKVIIGG